jgi:hypothetical protein
MFWPKKCEGAGGGKKLHDAGFIIYTLVNSVLGLYYVVPCNDADF